MINSNRDIQLTDSFKRLRVENACRMTALRKPLHLKANVAGVVQFREIVGILTQRHSLLTEDRVEISYVAVQNCFCR